MKLPLLLFPVLIASGCASVSTHDSTNDPLEPVNRAIYSVNERVDKAVVKPAAKGYNALVPDPLNEGISNFFKNLNDITVIGNDLLQFKLKQATSDTGRFLLNTIVGFFGFFDPASEYGLPKHNEDFGQTLGYWGVPSGPYLVLPLLGPSSVRDAPALHVDSTIFEPTWYVRKAMTRHVLLGTKMLDMRAGLLSAEKVLDEAALDPYLFIRNAYLQRREALVTDGNLPEEEIDDDELFGDME